MITRENIATSQGVLAGVSDWIAVPQSRIDSFAACTEDRQWIHVDVARTKNETELQAPIAHGFLTLSLLPQAFYQILRELRPTKTINYGLDKVRFLSPVVAGSRVRVQLKIIEVIPRDDGWTMMKTESTVQVEGQAKSAMVAISLGLYSWA